MFRVALLVIFVFASLQNTQAGVCEADKNCDLDAWQKNIICRITGPQSTSSTSSTPSKQSDLLVFAGENENAENKPSDSSTDNNASGTGSTDNNASGSGSTDNNASGSGSNDNQPNDSTNNKPSDGDQTGSTTTETAAERRKKTGYMDDTVIGTYDLSIQKQMKNRCSTILQQINNTLTNSFTGTDAEKLTMLQDAEKKLMNIGPLMYGSFWKYSWCQLKDTTSSRVACGDRKFNAPNC